MAIPSKAYTLSAETKQKLLEGLYKVIAENSLQPAISQPSTSQTENDGSTTNDEACAEGRNIPAARCRNLINDLPLSLKMAYKYGDTNLGKSSSTDANVREDHGRPNPGEGFW
ncbi:hypothetical protein MMC24_002815 [Lignoscripta atroalba]|nr:hypothetical protein [Lignoscripta atroalba]